MIFYFSTCSNCHDCKYTHTISQDCYIGIVRLESQEELISTRLLSLIESREGIRGFLEKHSLLLSHDTSVFISSLPISIPSSHEGEKLSLTMKQLQRDIERDVIVVNGIKILGSIGIEEVINEICKAVDIAFSSCQLKEALGELKREFAIACLKKAARTNSGGNSFQALQVLKKVFYLHNIIL